MNKKIFGLVSILNINSYQKNKNNTPERQINDNYQSNWKTLVHNVSVKL